MNISLSFNTIINTCLKDISNSLTNCSKQIEITNENILQIEQSLKENSSSKHLQTLINKNKKLLLDNFCLITEQAQLITHYHQLISIMNRKNLLSDVKKEQEVLNDLLGYYERNDKDYNVSLIKKYLEKIA